MANKLINWNERFIIDNSSIDEQHKQLINIINDLYSAFVEGKVNEVIENIIIELKKYIIFHFKTEEDFFDRVNYIHKEEHIGEHRKFIDQISAFNESFINSQTSLSYDIMNFLRDWLQNHILVSDKKYTPYL